MLKWLLTILAKRKEQRSPATIPQGSGNSPQPRARALRIIEINRSDANTKKILVLFAKDWDRLEFRRPEYRGRYEFIHEGFDLFRFPDNARLLTFDVFAYINALAREMKWLGSYRYAVVNMGAANPDDLHRRYADMRARLFRE